MAEDTYSNYVKVWDRYTPTSWERKIGDGPWVQMDLSAWHGLAPVVFLTDKQSAETETWAGGKGSGK